MPASATVDDRGVLIDLAGLRAGVADRRAIYVILGQVMMASITQTFREEGSPAGSWPQLALSTLRRKNRKAGSKMLYQSGRLFRSVRPEVTDEQLTIAAGGPDLPYARVQQVGSADRWGGSIGAQAKVPDRAVEVKAYDYSRLLGFGRDTSRSKRGRKAAIQGPGRKISVPAHERHQNIPARPYLVFRPEDPGKLVESVDIYLQRFPVARGGAA